ncbi:MurR/RpiR family transcriptional regulator [Lactiplantibacillus fabifermentans]|uniref:Transcription regulator n=2 Tax=Lactiplantibacillus fabifermentans TaxID=483011 RepID=A0A0R2NJM4_9LACO|nr:MurR/RpiR family transcriptional regulator [Lactiplantibacillus fabifermentans]ETY75403.1 RpiR family transcriptional regulator [Lactiplantibacillus fabifermentans T30PCM01]KRO25058.1 hypothetical protein DY78_GL001413 [Lactiplantibacillus fabifermentans DSM 21115]
MFSYEQIQQLNQLELTVYDYIISHKKAITKMTIRELAEACHVSTTTVLRFCNKVGLDGFSELKYALKQRLAPAVAEPQMRNVVDSVNEFLTRFKDPSFQASIDEAAQLMMKADLILFFGIGTSGSFARYGARLLANLGFYTLTITDPFQPQPKMLAGQAKIVLVDVSVSGEREQVIKQAQIYRELGAKVVGLTNNGLSPLASLADVNLAYNVHEVLNGDVDLTTQVPVVLILEEIMHAVQKLQ